MSAGHLPPNLYAPEEPLHLRLCQARLHAVLEAHGHQSSCQCWCHDGRNALALWGEVDPLPQPAR